jgi:NADH-quinone oxidoreductase subunit H
MNRELLVMIGKAIASLFLIANYGLILSGVMYKIIARVHGRFGPPVWQPYINLAKLLSMRTAVSHGIMFYLGPIFRITGGVGLYLLIPAVYGSSWLGNFSFSGDIILVLYFIFFGMLGMALGAAESGHPHSSFLFMMSFNRAFFGSAKLVLFMNLFFGGATSIPEMIIKTFLIMLWTVFVGVVFPRYRLEQSVRWLLKVPALIGLLALALQMF